MEEAVDPRMTYLASGEGDCGESNPMRLERREGEEHEGKGDCSCGCRPRLLDEPTKAKHPHPSERASEDLGMGLAGPGRACQPAPYIRGMLWPH